MLIQLGMFIVHPIVIHAPPPPAPFKRTQPPIKPKQNFATVVPDQLSITLSVSDVSLLYQCMLLVSLICLHHIFYGLHQRLQAVEKM